MKYLMFVMSLFVVGCGSDAVMSGPQGPAGHAAIPTSSVYPAVQALVDQENSHRRSLGQTIIAPGLSCTLHKVTGGQFIQSGASYTPTLTGITQAASFTHMGVFNQENAPVSQGLDVLPPALRSNPTYQNLIMLRCTGFLVVVTTDWYSFELSSDDGSVLYLGGSRLIDNDGAHSVITKIGSKHMRQGVHAFRLDFAQTGGGSQALILKSSGVIVPSSLFYH